MEIDDQAVPISRETLNRLQALGIIDEQNRITPEAYVGYISRLPVSRQAEALGLPLILLPPPKIEESPEAKVIKFFSKDKEIYVDGGYEESYLLKSFIGSITESFDSRRRKHSLTPAEIDSAAEKVAGLTESKVMRLLEKNNVVFQQHFGFSHGIKMPQRIEVGEIDFAYLKRRFNSASCYKFLDAALNDLAGDEKRCIEYLAAPSSSTQYAENMIRYIWLWRSLSPLEWRSLIKVVLANWEKMATGWPDLNLVSPTYGLILVEVKGKDKLHTSQIYTLLRLRDVLGPERVAIAWTNAVASDIPFDNAQHQRSVWEWVRAGNRRKDHHIENWLQFYNASKALVS